MKRWNYTMKVLRSCFFSGHKRRANGRRRNNDSPWFIHDDHDDHDDTVRDRCYETIMKLRQSKKC